MHIYVTKSEKTRRKIYKLSDPFAHFYRQKLSDGTLTPDAAQQSVVEALNALEQRLETYNPQQNQGIVASFFGRKDLSKGAPLGLYLFGGVGRGKTMLMDLFYEHISFEPRGRYHFNEFMAMSHDKIAEFRKTQKGDPIPLLAEKIADTAKLLCFDEFYVSDIADAMLLGRLFDGLYKEGVVIVATSNCPLDELYKDGLNRQLFEPFIRQMQEKMVSHEVISPTDFRLRAIEGVELYFTPSNQRADEQLCLLWQKITGKGEGKQATIIVKGRTLIVPEAANGAARFTFSDLCEEALGRDDYLALAQRYHTIFIEDIPQMGPDQRNQARRFITLIDTLYDSQIRLIATAEVGPTELYSAGDNAFLFERTASRLIEMQQGAHLKTGAETTEKHKHDSHHAIKQLINP